MSDTVPEGLDFAQAQQALQSAGVGFPDFIIAQPARDALNAQVAEIVQRAREEAICEERRHTQTTIDQTRAEYAPLVALVRRFQETVAVVKAEVGTPLTEEVHVHGREYAEAHAALEAFDLGKEGA